MQENRGPDTPPPMKPPIAGAGAPSTEGGNAEPRPSDKRPFQQPFDRMSTLGLEETFTYHAPDPALLEHYEAIRSAALVFAMVLAQHVPHCGDKVVAIRHVRDAVMNANAAVALRGLW